MKTKLHRLSALLLTAAILFSATPPLPTASAMVFVDVTNANVHTAVQAAINDNPVVVVRSTEEVFTTATLTLNIPEETTVVWYANLTNTTNVVAVSLTGDGAFEVRNGGSITAGNTSAIRSAGTPISINGGTVTNAATSNITPTINVTAGTGMNVTIRDGLVETKNPSATSYVIQTTGGVLVEGGEVRAIAGRAINLVGMDSVAIIADGTVYSEKGVAISTATTNTALVRNASVTVIGGTVSTETGTAAIQTTGTNGNVGIFSGKVTAQSGLAIRSTGNVEITHDAFVFAYGTSIGQVVSAPNIDRLYPAVVAAWNSGTLNPSYIEGTDNDLVILGDASWKANTPHDGIEYGAEGSKLFFPLEDVTVASAATKSQGLIFDIGEGTFNLDEVNAEEGTTWEWDGETLTLKNFTWVTNSRNQTALTIVRGDSMTENITLNLVGDNTFITSGSGSGIFSAAHIIVEGDGTLNVSSAGGFGINGRDFTLRGGKVYVSTAANAHGMNLYNLFVDGGELSASSNGSATSGAVYGINITASLGIIDGAITATGSSRAITSAALGLPPNYTYAIGSRADGSNAAEYEYPGAAAYSHSNSNRRYVRIEALPPPPHPEQEYYLVVDGYGHGYHPAGAEVTINTLVRTEAPVQIGPVVPTTKPPYMYDNEVDDFFIEWTSDSGGAFADASARSTTFTMPANNVAVTARTETVYKLFLSGGRIDVGEGSPSLGYYPAGAVVDLASHSQYSDGWRFQGWTITDRGTPPTPPVPPVRPEPPTSSTVGTPIPGLEFSDPNSVHTTFTMPASNVVIEARWYQDTASVDPSAPVFTLTVVGGTSPLPNWQAGAWPLIEAEDPPPGQAFSHWVITEFDGDADAFPGAFTNATAQSTYFNMPEGSVTIQAAYVYQEFNLTVIEGSGSGPYHVGDIIALAAFEPFEGMEFAGWKVMSGGGVLENAVSQYATFTMPGEDVTITATFAYPSEPYFPPYVPSEEDEDEDEEEEEDEEPDEPCDICDPDDPICTPDNPCPRPCVVCDPEEPVCTPEEPCLVLTHWAYVVGVGHGLFAPEKELTRAEAAQMLYNLLPDEEEDTALTAAFPDVPEGAWYERAVDRLAALGVISGCPDGLFDPLRDITRAELVTMATLFVDHAADETLEAAFPDVTAAHWAYAYINTAAAHGWISGTSDGLFEPDRGITRAEAVAVLNNAVGRAPDKAFIDGHPDITRFADVAEDYWAFYHITEAYHTHDYAPRDAAEIWVTVR